MKWTRGTVWGTGLSQLGGNDPRRSTLSDAALFRGWYFVTCKLLIFTVDTYIDEMMSDYIIQKQPKKVGFERLKKQRKSPRVSVVAMSTSVVLSYSTWKALRYEPIHFYLDGLSHTDQKAPLTCLCAIVEIIQIKVYLLLLWRFINTELLFNQILNIRSYG